MYCLSSKERLDSLYVYYYLQFIYNLGAFFNFEGKTSGIKNLQLDAAFAAIPIEDISESIQNNIVAILQGLERKIAINRQINQNLPTLDHSAEVGEVRLAA
ncbi:restriction endonuclease subunit S [Bacteroides fragilis]|nr:restriction endonuclease subunit S [Bacteroides fragilis]